MLPGPVVPGPCLVSFLILWAIHPIRPVQCSCSGWPKGYGKKLSSSQEQLGQATCLAVAYFFPFPVAILSTNIVLKINFDDKLLT